MEKLQLFFSNTRSLASYCVRFATWGEYGHVGLYRDDTIIEANSTLNKVVCRSFEPSEYSQFVIKEYDIPAKPVWDIISSQIDKPYDWSAIYGFLFRQDWQSPDKWFCSELVEWGCNSIGYSMINKKSWRVSPQDLNEVKSINILRTYWNYHF